MSAVQVTGTWLRADGTPDRGHVDFCLVPEALDIAGPQRTGSVVRAVLDASGSIDIALVPDADLVGVDGDAVYAVSERIGGMDRDWWLHIPDDSEPIDLPSRFPGDGNEGVAVLPIPGEAATVEVGTTTTGDPGTEASVVNSGTAGAVVLDFTIPRGYGQDVPVLARRFLWNDTLNDGTADPGLGYVAKDDEGGFGGITRLVWSKTDNDGNLTVAGGLALGDTITLINATRDSFAYLTVNGAVVDHDPTHWEVPVSLISSSGNPRDDDLVVISATLGGQAAHSHQGRYVGIGADTSVTPLRMAAMSQAEYDALSPPDPNTLYIIAG